MQYTFLVIRIIRITPKWIAFMKRDIKFANYFKTYNHENIRFDL